MGGGPAWTLEFVPLPAWATSPAPVEFQQRVERYATVLSSNTKTWTWADVSPDLKGDSKAARDARKAVKDAAIAQGIVPTVPVNANDFADFSGHVLTETTLPQSFWGMTDDQQFNYLNQQFGGTQPPGYTWHHHQDPGRMQLVAFGVHNMTSHHGGRDVWCSGPR